MSPAFMGFLFGVWAVLAILDTAYAATTLEGGALSALLQFNIISTAQVDLLLVKFNIPFPNVGWFLSFGDLVALNQGLFSGWAMYIRLFVLGLMAAFIAQIVMFLFSAFLQRRPF